MLVDISWAIRHCDLGRYITMAFQLGRDLRVLQSRLDHLGDRWVNKLCMAVSASRVLQMGQLEVDCGFEV